MGLRSKQPPRSPPNNPLLSTTSCSPFLLVEQFLHWPSHAISSVDLYFVFLLAPLYIRRLRRRSLVHLCRGRSGVNSSSPHHLVCRSSIRDSLMGTPTTVVVRVGIKLRRYSYSSPRRVWCIMSRSMSTNSVTRALFTRSTFRSLEQVPETGRWRFMDISPNFEAKLEKASYASLLSEFEGKILPAHHPITHHVHRVVSDLLEASDLGALSSNNPRKPPVDDDGFWHDDPFGTARPHDSPGGSGKQWNLLVVDDPKIVNALASFGM